MIEVIPFLPAQFDFFVPKNKDQISIQDMITFYSWENTDVRALIDFEKKIVIGFVGMMKLCSGIAEVFFYPSIHVKEYKKQLIKKIKELIEFIVNKHKLRRVQMTIDNLDNWKFTEFIGFSFEGKLRAYTSSNGLGYLFARTF